MSKSNAAKHAAVDRQRRIYINKVRLKRFSRPIPLPPSPPNLSPADLEAIREIVDASAAEIGRQLREMLLRTASEWQPIQTADIGPNRKAVLGWFPDVKCAFTIIWDKHDQRWTYFGGHGAPLSKPSYWMALREPPK